MNSVNPIICNYSAYSFSNCINVTYKSINIQIIPLFLFAFNTAPKSFNHIHQTEATPLTT